MKRGQQLQVWQERLQKNESAYKKELQAMDERTGLYEGSRSVTPSTGARGKPPKESSMVRNIVSELVEAQVDGGVPMPKVTARREADEALAKTVEDYLRNELDRIDFEVLNDMDERICPVQGGDFFLVQWDADRHTHETRGALSVTLLHPKQVIPQHGVNEINDMDFIIVRLPMSKAHVLSSYGKNVWDEGEANPETRGGSGSADDIVTVNIGYYRNEGGGIGRYVWVNDITLEDLEDYQARRGKVCAKCDQPMDGAETCRYCGSTKTKDSTYEEFILYEDITQQDGTVIPAYQEKESMPLEGMQETITDIYTGEAFQAVTQRRMEPTGIPYYKPDSYPIVLRKNVSAWGKVLGDSDVDKVKDQQNAIKKCDTRIQDKLDKGGSVLTKHQNSHMDFTDEQLKIIEVENPAEISCFGIHNLQVDIGMDRLVADDNYQNARNIIGITDSFQGRSDRTATSGVAKQIAVAQSAGRLESKRIMKNAMYAQLFQIMFQFILAYSDEPRVVRHATLDGNVAYSTFNPTDFLRKDAAGQWYWVDDFLFSVDNSSALAGNREALWQETRMNFQTGAFGMPQEIGTQILFWKIMGKLHYPLADEIRTQLEETLEKTQSRGIEPGADGVAMAEEGQGIDPMGQLAGLMGGGGGL